MDPFIRWLEIIKFGVGLAVLWVVVWYVLLPLYKGLKSPMGTESPSPKAAPPQPELPPANPPKEPPTPKEIIESAKADPILTAQLVRQWLKEKG